jgi:pyruvate dehydrogenase E1 component alpha subunit
MDKSPYRSADEEAAGRKRDPVAHARAAVLARSLASAKQLDELDAEISREMSAAIDFTAKSPAPALDTMSRDVYGEGQARPESVNARLERVLARD